MQLHRVWDNIMGVKVYILEKEDSDCFETVTFIFQSSKYSLTMTTFG